MLLNTANDPGRSIHTVASEVEHMRALDLRVLVVEDLLSTGVELA